MSNKQYGVEVTTALCNFPYFVLRNEIKTGYNLYTQELLQIQQNYIDYKKGAKFYTEGSAGDYVPSNIKFKIAKTLIDKEARFMFSQTPDFFVQPIDTDDKTSTEAQEYQKLIDKVLNNKNNNFSRALIQGAKDCFIGKRVACLVDFSEEDGIQTHFYSSLQFYYETEYGSDRLTKFISFENVSESKTTSERMYLVNRYEERNSVIYMSSILYNGSGKQIEVLIKETPTQLEYIPAIVIFNDGTLQDKRGVSEMESLSEYEEGYSRLSNGDIDSERKGMNPIRYTVDMSPNTTKNLPSGAGAYWDLQSNQNIDSKSPMVGTLAPQMNHTESYNIQVVENYALMEDEETEKDSDLAEIAANARSRKSYIKKWRKEEFKTDEQIEQELMQIAIEQNMFDSMSMNTQVQSELNKRGTEEEVDNNLEDVQMQKKLGE